METVLKLYFNGFSVLLNFAIPSKKDADKSPNSVNSNSGLKSSLKYGHERKVSNTDSWIFNKKDLRSDTLAGNNTNNASYKYRAHSFSLLSLTNDTGEQVSERDESSSDGDSLKQELFETYNPELAHKSYFSLSRYTSR